MWNRKKRGSNVAWIIDQILANIVHAHLLTHHSFFCFFYFQLSISLFVFRNIEVACDPDRSGATKIGTTCELPSGIHIFFHLITQCASLLRVREEATRDHACGIYLLYYCWKNGLALSPKNNCCDIFVGSYPELWLYMNNLSTRENKRNYDFFFVYYYFFPVLGQEIYMYLWLWSYI